MKIKEEVINVIADSTVENNLLFLPAKQLDRKLYVEVNKVLEILGGKWNRKLKAHVFETDIQDAIEQALQTGEVTDTKKEFNCFYTPEAVVKYILEQAELKASDKVLEPSAGQGAIVIHAERYVENRIHCIELMEGNRNYLKENGFNLIHDDFMTFEPEVKYDVIIANPPFTRQQDVKHINKMLDISDKVVSVASASVLFRDNKLTSDFRDRVIERGGVIEKLPDGAFKDSGTNVNTCLVVVK